MAGHAAGKSLEAWAERPEDLLTGEVDGGIKDAHVPNERYAHWFT